MRIFSDHQNPAVGTVLDHAHQTGLCGQSDSSCSKAYSLDSAGDVGGKSHHQYDV